MLANTMPSAVAQAMRACGRCLPAAKSLTASSAASRALLARRTFLITPSYKARIAVRAYATATATATKKAAATKTTKSSTTAAKAKKPAVKKAPVKATAKAKPKAKVVKKPATKKKAKKPVVKKPVVKKPKKLTEEKRLLLEKKELKQTAMLGSEPKVLPFTAWGVFSKQRFEKLAGTTMDFGSVMKTFAADFKNLSDSELSLLEQKVQENAAANAANYKKWVESHSVVEIHAANIARARLSRKFPKRIKVSHLKKIQDDRYPKRAINAWALFSKSHMAGITGSGKKLPELIKEASAQWKTLPDSEKKPYEDLQAADMARYRKEMDKLGLVVKEPRSGRAVA